MGCGGGAGCGRAGAAGAAPPKATNAATIPIYRARRDPDEISRVGGP
jgi:hypothetical protein